MADLPALHPPRKWIDKKCDYCGKEFIAFRTTARFCRDQCRVSAYNKKRKAGIREKVIAKFQNKCARCGKTDDRMFVRKDPETKEVLLLCGKHTSSLSNEMFYKRTGRPSGIRGYVLEKQLREAGVEYVVPAAN